MKTMKIRAVGRDGSLAMLVIFVYIIRPVHTAHSMRIQSGLMRIGLRSHCQVVNAH